MSTVMDRTAGAMGTSSYPVNFEADFPSNPGRLYAVPILGYVIRYLLLIPHLIALEILFLIVYVLQLVTWIPVLFGGNYPEGLYNFVAGTMRWGANTGAYFYGLTDKYPPFGFAEQDDFPVRVSFERPGQFNRLYAIPFIGLLIKEIILIPHIIALYILVAVTGIIHLVAWIPVLFGGNYPGWAYSMTTGTLRWSLRVIAFALGLTDVYPPFRLAA